MNEIGKSVLKAMESSSLGRMSIYILNKQSSDMGLDLSKMGIEDVPRLSERLKLVLPFFLGDETEEVLAQIRKLTQNGPMVMT